MFCNNATIIDCAIFCERCGCNCLGECSFCKNKSCCAMLLSHLTKVIAKKTQNHCWITMQSRLGTALYAERKKPPNCENRLGICLIRWNSGGIKNFQAPLFYSNRSDQGAVHQPAFAAFASWYQIPFCLSTDLFSSLRSLPPSPPVPPPILLIRGLTADTH